MWRQSDGRTAANYSRPPTYRRQDESAKWGNVQATALTPAVVCYPTVRTKLVQQYKQICLIAIKYIWFRSWISTVTPVTKVYSTERSRTEQRNATERNSNVKLSCVASFVQGLHKVTARSCVLCLGAGLIFGHIEPARVFNLINLMYYRQDRLQPATINAVLARDPQFFFLLRLQHKYPSQLSNTCFTEITTLGNCKCFMCFYLCLVCVSHSIIKGYLLT